ncbi:MAG TPA: tape measure protein, partial [Longimicrobium sp.]|nr:tape measure protein [Longimicrobium sp.]
MATERIEIASLFGVLGIDDSQFNRALQQAEQRFDATGRALKATGERTARDAATALDRATRDIVSGWERAARERERAEERAQRATNRILQQSIRETQAAARERAQAEARETRERERAEQQFAQTTARIWRTLNADQARQERERTRTAEREAHERERIERQNAAQVARIWQQNARAATASARRPAAGPPPASGGGAHFALDLNGALSAVERAFHSLGSTAQGVLNGILGVFGGLSRAVLSVAGDIIQGLGGAFERVLGVAERVGLVVGGTLTAAFVATAKAGVDFNTTLQGTSLALTRILGSQQAAAGLIGDLRKEALTSKLELKDLLPLGQQLAAVYGPGGLGKVIPTLRAFGDAASVLAGGDKEAASRALIQFRQLASGLLERENLRTIEENLPGSDVLGIVQRKFGTVDTQALKQAHVTGQMVADAIVAGFTEKFGGAQRELAGTLPVILSNFGDAFNE